VLPAQRLDARVRPAVLDRDGRAVYPFSVIRRGVYNSAELQAALASDGVAASHYEGFHAGRARREIVTRDRQAFVSYRMGGKVFWTKRAVTLREGETLLTDGTNCVRSRCGNRISDTPRLPVSAAEPRTVDSDVAELPAPPEFPAEFRPGGRGIALKPLLAPEIFPPIDIPSSQLGGQAVPDIAYLYIPPWARSGTTVPVPGGPTGGVIGEIYQPLPVVLPLAPGWTVQAPGSTTLRLPGVTAEVVPGPATVVQLLRPPTPSRTAPGGGTIRTPEIPTTPTGTSTPGTPGTPTVSTPTGGSTTSGGTTTTTGTPTLSVPPLPPEQPPASVPEPLTGLTAAGALGLFAGWRVWRRCASA
jgi:hypothetical protein